MSFNSPTTVKLYLRRHLIKLHVIFFSKNDCFDKFVVSLTIVNDNPSLTIVNDDPSLTIVNITVNKNFFHRFQNDRFFQKQSYKKTVANRFNKSDRFQIRSLFVF